MTGLIAIRGVRAQILRMNHRLRETGADPSNDDRALFGALVVAYFAAATARVEDMHADPETMLSDLLADLMHWCDLQRAAGNAYEPIGFDSALERAREYYMEERGDESEQDVSILE